MYMHVCMCVYIYVNEWVDGLHCCLSADVVPHILMKK